MISIKADVFLELLFKDLVTNFQVPISYDYQR